jgi:DNA-binding transcriptional regulator YiaG
VLNPPPAGTFDVQEVERMTTATVPVTLTIGDQKYPLGSIPELPGELRPAVLGDLLRIVRSDLEHTAAVIATDRDAAAILESHGDAMARIVREIPAPIDPVGPMTRYLREQAGMTRVDLTRAMQRSKGSVQAWENGQPTRFTLLDDWRASEALGYSRAALLAVAGTLLETREAAT